MNAASEQEQGRQRPVDPLVLVAAALAFHAVVHQLSFVDWGNSVYDAILTVAALACLVNPRSNARVVAFLLAFVATIGWMLPKMSNHWFQAGLFAAIFLASVGYAAIRDRKLTPGEAWAIATPLLRSLCVVLYFFVVFHKLNWDFLDPDLSCASDHLGKLRKKLPFVPDVRATRLMAIYGTLAIESAIPILLVIPRTRRVGIATGIAFHGLLGINGFVGFSALMNAFFCAFMPRHIGEEVARRWPDWSFGIGKRDGRRLRIHPGDLLVFGVVAPLLLWVALADVQISKSLFKLSKYGVRYAFIPIDLAILGAFWWLTSAKRWGFEPEPLTLRTRAPVLLVLPVLAFISGFSPYLGLKTEQSLAMFSNLGTEDGKSNHIIVGPGMQIAGYQKDLVTIHRTNDRVLRRRSRRHITYFTLKTRVSAVVAKDPQRRIKLDYTRNGERFQLEHAEKDPELSKPWSLLERKLLRFRPIRRTKDGRVRCSH